MSMEEAMEDGKFDYESDSMDTSSESDNEDNEVVLEEEKDNIDAPP